jgi:hypothetical protein
MQFGCVIGVYGCVWVLACFVQMKKSEEERRKDARSRKGSGEVWTEIDKALTSVWLRWIVHRLTRYVVDELLISHQRAYRQQAFSLSRTRLPVYGHLGYQLPCQASEE